MIRRPPRSTHCISSAASDVYKRQYQRRVHGIYDCYECDQSSSYELFGSAPQLCFPFTTGCSSCYNTECFNVYGGQCSSCESYAKIIFPQQDVTSSNHYTTCIKKQPDFWNKQDLIQNGFILYYGFDSSLTYIYMRLIGYNQGWIGLGLDISVCSSGTGTGQDWVIARFYDDELLLEDRFSATTELPSYDTYQSGQHDVQLISGTRYENYVWDVTFVRKLTTTDPKCVDVIIGTNTMVLTLALGSNDQYQKTEKQQKISMKFSQTQICHSTCASGKCTGPEEYQCTECPSGYGLVGNTRPNRCVIQSLTCHSTCATCYGTSYTECLTCTDSSKIPIEGICVSNTPAFWNKLVQTPYDSTLTNAPLSLYYGFSSDLNYIYFKFSGEVSQSKHGWIYLQFGTTSVDEDVVVVRIFDSNTLIEDRYIENINTIPVLDEELNGKFNYFYISGGKVSDVWNVVFARLANTDDDYDELINITPRNFQVYATDCTSAYNGVNEYFNIEYQLQYNAWTKTRFYNKQLCATNCIECIGPETTDCTACDTGYELASTATTSSYCVTETIVCTNGCLTCDLNDPSICLSCSGSYIVYDTNCIKNYPVNPVNWNKIHVKTDFDVYYGFDLNVKLIYFKVLGTNSGWVGIGFKETMQNSDMVLIYVASGSVVVQDRYSLGHAKPKLDPQQNVKLISGSRDASGYYNVIFVRYINTLDPIRDITLYPKLHNFTFAFGSSDTFSQHTSTPIIKSVLLSSKQVCADQCSACTGPETSQCTAWSTTSSINNYAPTQMFTQFVVLVVVTILCIIMT
eukprot:TRINITY_DN775_c0_g1_i2.p1 TRINITY_DN775_c0_g1~~TRINITY_DN775_c0_g1_i2.p1  ORF type:complete len:798 (-),score=132.01 TRINITY_DN775_c0_g1_i2:82-2475(-)